MVIWLTPPPPSTVHVVYEWYPMLRMLHVPCLEYLMNQAFSFARELPETRERRKDCYGKLLNVPIAYVQLVHLCFSMKRTYLSTYSLEGCLKITNSVGLIQRLWKIRKKFCASAYGPCSQFKLIAFFLDILGYIGCVHLLIALSKGS